MKKNMGTTDKTLRLSLALIFIVLFLTRVVSGPAGYILLGLAGIFLVTSFVGVCPLYALFGIHTGKRENA